MVATVVLLLACGGDQAKRAEPDGSQPGRDGSADPMDGSSGADGSSGGPHDSGGPGSDSGDGDGDAARPGEAGPGDASGGDGDSGQDGSVPMAMMRGASIEVGHVLYGSDYTTRPDVPPGGTLFSLWTKIPDTTTTYPWSRGNMDVYLLRGDNWFIRCLAGNMSAQSPTNARYAANTMLFAIVPGAPSVNTWVEDYGYYDTSFETEGTVLHDEALFRDWVWVAWWIKITEDRFIIREWVKFGLNGAVIDDTNEDVREVTFDKVRELLTSSRDGLRTWSAEEAAAWVPSQPTSFQVGSDQGYLTHVRMATQDTVPTLEQLDAIARHTQADTSAWADYPFVWTDNGPFLGDQSGHGRDLQLKAGGTFYQGPEGPGF